MRKKTVDRRKVLLGVAIVALLLGVVSAILAYTPVGSFVTGSFAKTTDPKTCSGKAPKCSGMVAVCKGDKWVCLKITPTATVVPTTTAAPTPTTVTILKYKCTFTLFGVQRETIMSAADAVDFVKWAASHPDYKNVSCRPIR